MSSLCPSHRSHTPRLSLVVCFSCVFSGAANDWTALEFCFWAEQELRSAVGSGEIDASGPGYGPDAFIGGGVRMSRVETYEWTVQSLFEAMTEFKVTGHHMAQMAAHKYPVDAVTWMLKALCLMTNYRKILTPAWIRRCNGARVCENVWSDVAWQGECSARISTLTCGPW